MRPFLFVLVLALPMPGQDPVAAARAAVTAAEERTGAESRETAQALLKLLQALANAPAQNEASRLQEVARHRQTLDRLLLWTSAQPALLPTAEVYARVLAWKGQVARGALDSQRVATASDAPSVPAVQEALPYRAALADFVLVSGPGGERRYFAFVLRGRHVRQVDLGPAAPIEQSVRSWLELLARSTRPGLQAVAAPIGRELRQRVFEPLAAAIGDSTRLFVGPDATLAMLPFETLPDGDEGGFLVERLVISYLQDATELTRAPIEDPGTTLLAFGDIDYGVSGAEPAVRRGVPRPFAPLPATADELAVFERLPDVATTAVRGQAASEQRLRESVAGAAFVHLATHGFCGVGGDREPQAVRGGVALAGANDSRDGDDGIVGIDEMARLDLRQCRLVVLSAYQTGLGEPFAGESLLALRRALRIAGARATVTSLWRVDDAATAPLMADFYTTLFGDERDPALALREAQLQALARARAANGGDGLPGLWGAFVTEGR